MMRWWWFGPAVTKTELEREMQLMRDGGIGGFEVQPVYPLVLTILRRESRPYRFSLTVTLMPCDSLLRKRVSWVCVSI